MAHRNTRRWRRVGAAMLVALLASIGSARGQTTHVVNQINKTFVSPDITIDVGDTVQWVWSGGDHTVTEGPGPAPTANTAFDASLDSMFPLVSITFDADMLLDYPRANHLYDYFCKFHWDDGMLGSVQVDSRWVNELNALTGFSGAPRLLGTGSLVAGSPLTLTLSNAKPSAASGLFVGFSSINAAFKGGVLVPNPDFLFLLGTNASGGSSLPTLWPAGIPSGFTIFFHWWIQDPAGALGFSASNALSGTVP